MSASSEAPIPLAGVAGFNRNQWQLSIGISGNLRLESVAGFDRNQWQPSRGIRTRVNQRGIWFVTIRRRGAAVLRRLHALPAQAWRRAALDIPKRRHQDVRYVDEPVTRGGYNGPIRQLAVDGLGRAE